MDNSIVLAEGSWRGSDYVATDQSKSLGSLVHINSIAIDIGTAMEEIESSVHEHFSIRGFVSRMREKDRKMCIPFVSDGDGNLVDDLPPLNVPTFRWWQCANCVPDIANERNTEAMLVERRIDVGTSSCINVDGEKDGLFIHSTENIGKRDESRDYGDGEDDDSSNRILMNSKPSCTEGHKYVTSNKDKAEVSGKEAGNPCHDIPEVNPLRITDNNTADASDIGHVVVRPLCIVGEPDNASVGSDGTKIALPHRRKPKVRSLVDIMADKKSPTSNNPGTRSASSSGMQVAYAETEAVSTQLELDAAADVAKGKRKIVFEEDGEGPLGVAQPSGTGKRSGGLMLDVEKTHRRVENSEPESERDASMRLELQLGAMTHRIKPRKRKAFDISKKMRHHTHTEDGTVPMGALSKMNAPPPLGEMERDFSSFLSGQQIERISNFAKNKRSEVEADRDHLMPPPQSKSILGDCSSKGKVALDLSLNSLMDTEKVSNDRSSSVQRGSIPDLNETFPYQTDTELGKEFPTLPLKRSLPLHKTLVHKRPGKKMNFEVSASVDVSASCSKDAARKGKRQLAVPELQNTDKNIERGRASADFPMEIVELLDKNQRARTDENARKHLLPETINNSLRGSPALYFDGTSNIPQANRRSGINITSGNTGVRQNIPLNFPPLSNRQLELEESQFRHFKSSTPSQHSKTQYPASSSIIRMPRSSEREDVLWAKMPFHLSIPQNHMGKTVRDIKGREGKTAIHMGSLDPYSNETIPAMQLLSLMDQGNVSTSSFKSFLPKPFAPSKHHIPRLNGNENRNFGSFFSQNRNSKDFTGSRYGVYCSGESSKRASSHLQGQIPQERPVTTNSALGVCTLNRNPADFSIPDARNEYTLSARDLKSRKRNVDGRKRQRARTGTSSRENI
ncbi:hypothetical protein BUALT_Bualt05G0072700 [Buddleja alternifolia]|uniref:Uncharacterized protein n=1 Tax=Buddleja alternifolia TaxID=168488 RepID=A0AAV6XJ87_9LAMI|nr:hypothetical protein BUALT_Bualt05G0072700 [Buddleja alternifolia]